MKEVLLEHRSRKPFVPFRIMLTGGGAVEVITPYQLAIGESVLHVMFPKSDRYTAVHLDQVIAVQATGGVH